MITTMNTRFKFLLFLLLLATSACRFTSQKGEIVEALKSGGVNKISISGKPSLRGVDVVDKNIAWVSGSKATFARSIDGGKTWLSGKIGNDTLLDFRDIHAFSAESAIAISAGSPARIYKTVDGGKTWDLRYENTDSLVFFDSFDFCDEMHGVACSDPVNGNFLFIMTNNGGMTWYPIDTTILPKPQGHEAGFAASGTSVVCSLDGTILFGTGGDAVRTIRSGNFGNTWDALQTPIKSGASYGIYTICPIENSSYIAAGGCWEKPDEAIQNVAISSDAGKNWTLTKTFPSGFCSCIRYLKKSKSIVTCGTNGADMSKDMGNTWEKLPIKGCNAFDVSDDEAFIVFAGSKGDIAFISSSR